MSRSRPFRPGDCVVFRAEKHSAHPTPRATEVRPEQAGEGYLYYVDKFWRVIDVRDDHLVVQTRRGKTRVVDSNDASLHPASWWQRVIYRRRFARLDDATDQHNAVSS